MFAGMQVEPTDVLHQGYSPSNVTRSPGVFYYRVNVADGGPTVKQHWILSVFDVI